MLDWPAISVAFFIGILGGGHCIGMCGGIMAALTMSTKADAYIKRFFLVVSYNVGRILSYLMIAFVFAILINSVENYFALQFMRILSSVLLIAMGFYLADWWRGLIYLEKGGQYLWRYIQPLGKKLMPVSNFPQALFLGALWGWLPCGLIYSALAFSAAAADVWNSVAIMLAFALGTLPAVMVSGLLAERLLAWINHKKIRSLFAVMIILFGIWTLYSSFLHIHH